jgi:hypothetical protein
LYANDVESEANAMNQKRDQRKKTAKKPMMIMKAKWKRVIAFKARRGRS